MMGMYEPNPSFAGLCMNFSSSAAFYARITLLALLPAVAASCKPREFNDASVSSELNPAESHSEALTSTLLPVWPAPKTLNDAQLLPSSTDLGLTESLFGSLIRGMFIHPATGRPLTIATPQCALTPRSWKVNSARLSLYEIDLPGNVTNWQTLALQRETDLGQRVQLHVTMQPWCSSKRLNTPNFMHTLDQSLLLTFDLTLQQLPDKYQNWLNKLATSSKSESGRVVSSELEILPYARALNDIHNTNRGRSALLTEWKNSLKNDSLSREKKIPDSAWLQLTQSFGLGQKIKTDSVSAYAHPALAANPKALNQFFKTHISQRNLTRVRAHITEGLGTAQYFLLWEQRPSGLQKVKLQTSGATWDRSSDKLMLTPLLAQPSDYALVGAKLKTLPNQRLLVADADLESTVMADDIPQKELIALSSKVIDFEKTSVHSTRCVSCHALDDAYRFAVSGTPVNQRGIQPTQLSLSGYNLDGRPVLNIRSLRQAESDAKRYLRENPSGMHAAHDQKQ